MRALNLNDYTGIVIKFINIKSNLIKEVWFGFDCKTKCIKVKAKVDCHERKIWGDFTTNCITKINNKLIKEILSMHDHVTQVVKKISCLRNKYNLSLVGTDHLHNL